VRERSPVRSGSCPRRAKRSSLCPRSTFRSRTRPILAAALSANATVLVTGDRRHFGALFGKTLNRTVTVLPPREALERLLRQ